MRFRNIWFRELPPRPIEGGTDGYLSTEATMVKRREMAASLRQDAAHLASADNHLPEMLRLMESLVYDRDQTTLHQVDQLARQYVADLKALPADQLSAKKDDVKNVSGAFKFLARFKIMPANFEPAMALDQMIKDQGWDKKKSSS